MKCKKCKKECLESELVSGFCSDCIEKYKNNIEELNNIKNPVANEFKYISIAIIVIGFILGFCCFIFDKSVFSGVLCIALGLTISLFYRAIKEIIQLLEDIKNK